MEESDDGRKGRDIGGGGAVFERGKVDVPVVNGDEYVLVTVHRFDGEASREISRRSLAPVSGEGEAFEGGVIRVGEAWIRGGVGVRESLEATERQVGGGVLRVDATPCRRVSRCPYAVARERGGNFRARVIVEWVSDMLDGWMDGWVKTDLISTVDPKLIDQTLHENEC